MIINSVIDIKSPPLFYQFSNFYNINQLYLKLEGLNIAGSIKLKTALGLITDLENRGALSPGKSTIIESSSGNLGVALSILCKIKGYPFVCVTDPNISPYNEKIMHVYGAQIVKVTHQDSNGGFLGTRIAYIKNLLASHEDIVWTNQYANLANIQAHYDTTAQEIHHQFPRLDYLFIGAGTCGTLMGCATYFKKHQLPTKIIAIDAHGSVTFGGKPGKRKIPGLGTSRKPEIVCHDAIDDIIYVDEIATIHMSEDLLANHTLFLGGSSATILAGIKKYAKHIHGPAIAVAVSPDFGMPYLESIYSKCWVNKNYQMDGMKEPFYA